MSLRLYQVRKRWRQALASVSVFSNTYFLQKIMFVVTVSRSQLRSYRMESADHHCFEDDDGAAANLCQSYAAAESSKNTTADCSDGMIIGLNAWIDAAIQALKTSSATTGNSNQNQHKNVVCSR